ncbi:MAG: heavy metal sensor histidine kinase [Sulfuricellaceae bacterium]|nr:heavy metal sensor histidine kinase [Sulfuricellaceae bacterium]
MRPGFFLARQSLTLRLTALFAAASTVVLLGLSWVVGQAVERHFESMDMGELGGKIELVRNILSKTRGVEEKTLLQRRLDDALVGHHHMSVQVLDADGQMLYRAGEANFPARLMTDEVGRPLLWDDGHAIFRGLSARLSEPGMEAVAVAIDISHHQHFMHEFRSTLWRFVLAAALLSGILGWVAARRGLLPLRVIRQGAAEVTASRLNYRLPVAAIPLELADLADTLNKMLARLEASFLRLSDFSSDLAHELRTPLSNLMTQSQVVLSRARSNEEYREALASSTEEVERLARMVSDMLFLARSDNGLAALEREPVDLAAEVRDLFDFYSALADENGLSLMQEGNARVSGDKLMLRRAMSNLLANAIRHTPRGGVIKVAIEPDESGARLRIENPGETIPPEHLPRLFDRFYRVDSSRQHLGDGAGLGLAITQAIIQAHGGKISVRSLDGVTCFEFYLPE